MNRLASALTALVLVTLVGCGSSEPPQAAQSPDPDPTSSLAPGSLGVVSTPADLASAPTPSPTDVVSQFLDEVRRGGEGSRANDFLTERARAELGKIGQSVQPLGSPDAQYRVTRSQEVPGQQGSMLVHCVWSEPSENGDKSDFQVVWAVQREPEGWRISGLAIEVDPNQDPVVLDFENSELMARHLSPSTGAASQSGADKSQTTESGGEASQAAAPNQAISR